MKVCIAGGGRVGRYLAQSLLANHHSVVIIEPVEAQCRMLADQLDIPVICGDSINMDTLRSADAASCDAFVAVTNTDETNLVRTTSSPARSRSGNSASTAPWPVPPTPRTGNCSTPSAWTPWSAAPTT